jgi:hypothetical protein
LIITWKDTTLDEDGFKVERTDEKGQFIEISETAQNTESFTDQPAPNQIYTYRVTAFKKNGTTSTYSNNVSINFSSNPLVKNPPQQSPPNQNNPIFIPDPSLNNIVNPTLPPPPKSKHKSLSLCYVITALNNRQNELFNRSELISFRDHSLGWNISGINICRIYSKTSLIPAFLATAQKSIHDNISITVYLYIFYVHIRDRSYCSSLLRESTLFVR